MKPSVDRIRAAAYERWERRGRPHGSDQADWFAAEGALMRSLNYELVIGDRLDGSSRRELGDRRKRLCRFCGQSAPRTSFSAPVPALPVHLGVSSWVAFDQCDDCLDLFREGIDREFEAFLSFVEEGGDPVPDRIPIGAFKGLVRLALSLLSREDLETYEDAIEWISNPDHEFDRNAFADLRCLLHLAGSSSPTPWAALIRRTDHAEALPYLVFFLGRDRFLFQISVPLGQRDEEFDGPPIALAAIAPPAPFGIAHEPVARVVLAIPLRSVSRGSSREMVGV